MQPLDEEQAEERTQLENWVQVGIDRGWISPPFCNTHDGDQFMTEAEEQEWEEGGDPCMPVFKILVP
jgi:hypothetical protein